MTTRPDAAIARLAGRYYNENAVSATNPGGLDESDDGLTAGHVTNFPSALVDVGQAVAYAGEMAAAADTAAGTAGPAAAAASASALAAAASQAGAAASAATSQTAATAAAASATAAAGSATQAAASAAAVGGWVPAALLVWDSGTADADPGAGKLRLNSATLTAATALYLSTTDAAAVSIAAIVDRWCDSTTTIKGTLRVANRQAAGKWVEYLVTGSVVSGGGYRKLTLIGGAGPGGFVAGDPVAVGFSRTGDAGYVTGSFPAGTLAAPGWPVAGDGNTGLAQIGGADSVSLVAGGAEVLRTSVNAARVYGSLTLGDRGDGFGTALAFTPVSGSGPDVHAYVRTSDGALVFFLNKNRLGATVSIEALVIRDSGVVDFAQRPTVNGAPISGGFIPTDLSSSYTVIAADAGKLFNCTGTVTLGLTAAATLGTGFTVVVRNAGVGSVVIDPSGSETVNGALTITLVPSDWAILVCNGASWTALKQYGQSASSEMWSSSDKEAALSLTNGNLTASVSGATMQSGRGVTALSGKRYFEARLDVAAASGLSAIIGIATAAASFGSSYGFATGSGGYGFASDTGNKLNNSSQSAYGSSFNTAGTVAGFAYDDVSTPGTVMIWLAINGVWQASGNPATGANPAFSVSSSVFYPAITCKDGGQVTARFTGTLWSYSAPTGFSAIP
jgi:hypothetical protein